LAHTAASLHRIRFDENGLLGPGPAVAQPFASYVDGTVGHLEWCLEQEEARRRLGAGRHDKLVECISQQPHDFQSPSVTRQLCHGDFNQKNLLVDRSERGGWRLTAVLDWEFALSAAGVMDVGNLLRFEDESPAVESERFSAAYREAGGTLDDNWHAQAMFADLLAQLTFIVEKEERPRTFATALGVIDRYLVAIAA
jgi:Ser/Thr protein kinase RdoA (MazF antagonist)